MSDKRFGKDVLKKWARRSVRGVAFMAAVACAWPRHDSAWLAGVVPALSPFNACLTVAAGAGGLFLLGALVPAWLSVIWPRVFCRWLCPAGTCQDVLAGWVPKRGWVGRVPRIGLGIVVVAVGAALVGYPLFGWLDPLVLFNAAFGAARRQFERRDWLAAAGLPALLFLAFLAPGLWCGRLCPLGALQDLLRFPLRLRALDAAARRSESAALGRRAFLGLGLGAGYRLALHPARAMTPAAIRPPAADGEARFTRLCTRCGACVRSCPSGIIRFGGTGTGWAGVLVPEVTFDNGYCPPSCTQCGQVCPSGAIPRFTTKNKHRRPMGLPCVDDNHCLLSFSRECGACVGACPYGALDMDWDPDNMTSRIVIDAARCTGCGCCEYVCPSSPKAMRVHA
ncbi:MAG TPA: 4Fe-4S dicluster domain-containing protein [Kiritimatiellia bacterium]|nr:4Fe-4S dicluster domain-containing protein [Kiritimatiellia bacterium]HRU70505.1 4Fe-4S dicluster domain-containing protein [Kiritimatiellia bacterium]